MAEIPISFNCTQPILFRHPNGVRFVFTLLWLSLQSIGLSQDSEELRFSRDILPILSDKCFQCHGPDENRGREGDLRLDDEEDVKRDRGDYRVVTVGKPLESELIRRVLSKDPDEQMPPPHLDRRLTEQQIQTLQRWVEQGAPWGKHWAFEPIVRPELDSAVLLAGQSASVNRSHAIDVLVQRQLDVLGWTTNPSSDPATLARRVTLDLTGLPLKSQETQNFMDNASPETWEQLVDHLLRSPHYGERMAWDWMEVSRYADSNGYQGDRDRTMWPWRDWVVDAFNKNLPFDQFTIWQLAGDLLPDASAEQILATGFNRNHMINGEGGRIAEENRVDYVLDMTETMGTTWLGLTLNCCRCHDHKFDPLAQEDYYRFTAFFNQTPVDGSGGDPQTAPVIAVPSAEQLQSEERLTSAIDSLENQIESIRVSSAPLQPSWEQEVLDGHNSQWKTLQFSKRIAASGRSLDQDSASGTLLITGQSPDNDTYTLQARLEESTDLSAVWLEAIQHPSMPKNGYAPSGSGNFVLTEFETYWRPDEQSAWMPLNFASAEATFEQGDLKVNAAFDRNPQTGWAVYDGKEIVRDQWAIFRFLSPQRIPAGGEIQWILRHDSPHSKHNLAHFRISITASPDAALPGEEDRIVDLLRIARKDRSESQKKRIRTAFESQFSDLVQLQQDLRERNTELKTLREGFAKVMVMKDLSEQRKTFVLERGLYNQPGKEVQAGLPAAIDPQTSPATLNRLGLAQWLVAPDQPLTARVTVNRIWQMLFGIGLVKTSEDFGLQAEYPVQRELLDWLAAELIESNWNIKHLIKTIVVSQTYQRSSIILSPDRLERDPDNRFLARGPRYRLPSWMIRDQALTVSGLLSERMGGPAVKPYQPAGVWQEATFGNKKYDQDSGESLYRRSLYTFWRRIVGPTIFFDSAKRQTCEVKPLRTNTPIHALTTLNDTTYVEAARALAANAMRQDSQEQRMETVFQRVLWRNPTDQERQVLMRGLVSSQDYFQANPDARNAFLRVGEYLAPVELDAVELASWTAICLNVLNLDEALTKE